MKAIGVLCAALFALNSAVAQVNALAERTKTVAVLVLSGQTLHLKRIGVLVFGNAIGKVDVPDDRLAATIYERVRTELDAEQRYVVRRMELPAVDAKRLTEKAFEGSSRLWPSLGAMEADFAPYRAQCQCDALLLVAEQRREVAGTNQYYSGLTWLGGAGGAGVGAALMYYLMDPHTGKVVAKGYPWSNFARTSLAFPSKPDEAHELDSSTWGEVDRALSAHLQQYVREPLYKVGLRPSCTQYFYEFYTPESARNIVNSDYRAPPPTPAGADPERCR